MKLTFVFSVGKLSENTDGVEACFVNQASEKHIGLSIPSLSEDPQFARTMTRMWWLEPTSNRTLVVVVADDAASDARCGSVAREGFCRSEAPGRD